MSEKTEDLVATNSQVQNTVTIDADKLNDYLSEDHVINQYIEEESELHKTKYSVQK